MVVPIFDGVVLLDLAVLDVFTGANTLAAAAGIPGYEIKVASLGGGAVATGSNAELLAKSLSTLDLSEIDTILVPGTADYNAAHPPELVAWIREQAPRACRVDLCRSLSARRSGTAIEASCYDTLGCC
jgi:hypothetical protein